MPQPLSKEILLQQGSCCGNGCANCPYINARGERHQKGSTLIARPGMTESAYISKMAWGCTLYGCLTFGTLWTTLAKIIHFVSPPNRHKA